MKTHLVTTAAQIDEDIFARAEFLGKNHSLVKRVTGLKGWDDAFGL